MNPIIRLRLTILLKLHSNPVIPIAVLQALVQLPQRLHSNPRYELTQQRLIQHFIRFVVPNLAPVSGYIIPIIIIVLNLILILIFIPVFTIYMAALQALEIFNWALL